MGQNDDIKLFVLNETKEFGQQVAHELGIAPAEHLERDFEDGEHKTRSLINVRNKEVFVIQSLCSDSEKSVNDKLCKLLFFVGALKDASAKQVTVVVPYLCYARKDRKTKPRDPVTTRYVAALFEAVGTDHIITIDIHNLQAYQNAFRCRTEHLEARKLFTEFFISVIGDKNVVVLSPDAGGVKRADELRQSLGQKLGREVPMAFMEKQRSGGVVSGSKAIVGDVKGKTVIIIDDLISSGTTLSRAAASCMESGAELVYAAATHGVFTQEANRVLQEDALHKVVVTNTIPPFRLDESLIEDKLVIVNAAPLFAEAIKRIYSGGSIVELLENKEPEYVKL